MSDQIDNALQIKKLTSLIERNLKRSRRHYLTNVIAKFSPLAIILSIFITEFTTYFFEYNLNALMLLPLFLLIKYFFIERSKQYKCYTTENFLIHCNRYFPELEESAHLTFKAENNLSLLGRFQQVKVKRILLEILSNESLSQNKEINSKLTGNFSQFQSLFVGFLLLAGSYFFQPTYQFFANIINHSNNELAPMIERIENTASSVSKIISAQVIVEPPEYTRSMALLSSTIPVIAKTKSVSDANEESLNISAIAGSTVTWQLEFSNKSNRYFLEFSNGDKIELIIHEKNGTKSKSIFKASTVINHTGLYKIMSNDKTFMQLYTLTITQDEKPKIRILSPKDTVI